MALVQIGRLTAAQGPVLATVGMLLGVRLAQLLVRSQTIVSTIAGIPTRVGLDVTLDRRVLILALGVSAFTALVVSIAPVLQVMHVSPGAVLKDGAAGAVRRRSLGQRALVVVQVAAALVLLASSGVVYNAFRRVLAMDLGFDNRGLTVASADYWEPRLDSAGAIAYQREWLRRAAEEPGIAAVAVASVIPPAAWARALWVFRGGEEPPPGTRLGDSPAGGMRTYMNIVSPGFFDVMKLPITMGRGFLESDDDRGEPVIVVSRRLAAIAWPNENPLGKMLSLPAKQGKRRPAMRVVGVVSDVRFASIFDDAPPVAYMPAAQHPGENIIFAVRSRDGGVVPDATIRRIGAATDARVPMYTNVITDKIDEQLGPQRVASAWIGVFGVVALVLAATGLYGVVAQGVLLRMRELAVRSALGATPGGLVSLVIGDGMRIAGVGAVVGVVAAAAALELLQSQFDGVTLGDARGAVAAVGVVCVAMLAACWAPARRAGRLNPGDALRCD